MVYIQPLKTIKAFLRRSEEEAASTSFEAERAQAKAAVAQRVRKENKMKRCFVDTNPFVRYLTADDPAEA
ncbi:MAG: hypothetical protein MZV65_19745 [Chromatiales bacterium]|nr:hypothetical protein [Chromatiales bacterium]